MIVAVVPVKDLARAKQRLAARLGPAERRALVLVMLEDVLTALSRVPALSATMVVTRDREVATRARALGAEILEESVDDGYTGAVNLAARVLDERAKAPSMLVIPGDVPGITPEEIAAILEAAPPSPSVVLVPSRDERGTNAALVAPPRALELCFGEPSFAAHVDKAAGLELAARIMHLPGLALDLDTPDDLVSFLSKPSRTATYRFLLEGFRGKDRAPEALTSSRDAQ